MSMKRRQHGGNDRIMKRLQHGRKTMITKRRQHGLHNMTMKGRQHWEPRNAIAAHTCQHGNGNNVRMKRRRRWESSPRLSWVPCLRDGALPK
mmetsp:Transcript_120310/g.268880  ORF Transcript_120310/g.268880 Transcript_120310/m.268880 type:complete len:92 (-) Transcript_120310:1675-1950(-)